jgi:hypothetical protein
MLCPNFRNFGLKLLRPYGGGGHWLAIIGLNIIEYFDYFKILIS